MTRTQSPPDLDQRSNAISRAKDRLGITVPDSVIEAAEKQNKKKVKAKELPADYFFLLLEDEIVDTCIRAAINGRCSGCV